MRPSPTLLSTTLKSSSSTTTRRKPTRLTSSSKSPLPPPPLSLESFIQRQRVLSLYRTILRNLFRIPKDRRGEPIAYARGEFARNRAVTDLTQIRYLVSTGKTEWESMQRYVDEMAAR